MLGVWLQSWPSPPGFDSAVFRNARFGPQIQPLKQEIVGNVGATLWVVMGTLAMVLLIACANVASLLLVDAEIRGPELAIRAALGAGWRRIAGQLLAESMTLGVLGGALGLGPAYVGLRILAAESLLGEVRNAIWSVNGRQPVFSLVNTVGQLYDQSMARSSFTLVILAIVGGMALLLGIVGIYGVIAYAVSQTREIGVRMALGARPATTLPVFIRQGLLLAAIGVGVGLAAAVGLTRLMSSLLFGVSAVDPLTYAAVSALLLAAAVLASYVPARRAMAIDPVEALRAE